MTYCVENEKYFALLTQILVSFVMAQNKTQQIVKYSVNRAARLGSLKQASYSHVSRPVPGCRVEIISIVVITAYSC